jgi:hypothetical protein
MALHDAALATAQHRYATVCSTADLVGLWGVHAETTTTQGGEQA